MILIAGIPTESPVALAIEAAEESGIAFVVFDQRDHASSSIKLNLDPDLGWRATLTTPTDTIDLNSISGTYVRLMDERFLPGADASNPDPRSLRFHQLLHDWLNIAPGRVVSRPAAMLSNMSKTYQAGLIRRCGFEIPETLVTNCPQQALAFVARCKEANDDVIYKSISGTRSIVQTFQDEDVKRLERIRWCPTQFQRKVRGRDVRVHVIGDQVFATAIQSDATDYRYAQRQEGAPAELSATVLSLATQQACIELSTLLNLPFTGIDLRITPEGKTVCFEANPCPAYSYYEYHTGAPIARALVHWLAGLRSNDVVIPNDGDSLEAGGPVEDLSSLSTI
jgi:RimK-like ATP-grasp domain